jgi:thiopeptide-type bacteriocin biosynthesis protein
MSVTLLSPFDTFSVRTPLFSFEQILQKLKDENSILDLFNNPEIQEAIYIASPSLFDELNKNSNKDGTKNNHELVFAFTKYLIRMSTRCTPFGLFAGCSSGSQGSKNEIRLALFQEYKKHVRLDSLYSFHLANEIGKIDAIREKLKYAFNPTLYCVGNFFRYIFFDLKDNVKIYKTAEILSSSTFNILRQKVTGKVTINDLIDILSESGMTHIDANNYINILIDSQVLINDLEPKLTGGDMLFQIITRLKKLNSKEESINNLIFDLSKVLDLIFDLSNSKIGVELSCYKLLEKSIMSLPVKIQGMTKIQIDLEKPVLNATLSKNVYQDVQDALKFLFKLNTFEPNYYLEKFKQLFLEKYQDQEISLLEVLDPDIGLYYPVDSSGLMNPLVDDLSYINDFANSTHEKSELQLYISNIFLEAIGTNLYEVQLHGYNFDNITHNSTDNLGETYSAIISIANENSEQIICLNEHVVSGATKLIGRFSYFNDEFKSLTKTIAVKETELVQDKLLAEIVFIPQYRAANILQRDTIRMFEIPIMANSNVTTECQIELSDLMVSVKNNRIILRSKRLNRIILPRLSTAHNYSLNSIPAYRFLCDLQAQDFAPGLKFDWGYPYNEYKFNPRVKWKNVILQRAKWRLGKFDFQELLISDTKTLLTIIQKWRAKFNIPTNVAIVDDDSELFIDFENETLVKLFIHELKKRNNITLIETFVNRNQTIVNGPEGAFSHEIMLSFYRTKVNNEVSTIQPLDSQKITVNRNFFLGDEWLYYKLYCGAQSADNILTKVIAHCVSELVMKREIGKWFFIRYSDPHNHLRIRFQLQIGCDINDIISKLNAKMRQLVANRLIWKVQTDTYNREIERYGNDLIEHAEQLFHNDSVSTLDLLNKLPKDDQYRWTAGLVSMDKYFSDFGFDLNRKQRFVKNVVLKNYLQFNDNKIVLNKKYRMHKNLIDNLLGNKMFQNDQKNLLDIIYNSRSIRNSHCCNIIAEKVSEYKLHEYIQSYIHMSINRIFQEKQRDYELTLYYFLYKFYTSVQAKEKYSPIVL